MADQRLEQQVRLLEIELAKARAENTQLRKRLGENSRHLKRIERAYENALLMISWRSAGIKPSRRFAAHYHINQYRWENAVGLLRMARIIQGTSRWPIADLQEMERRLVQAKERAIADPALFFLRMNRHHNQ